MKEYLECYASFPCAFFKSDGLGGAPIEDPDILLVEVDSAIVQCRLSEAIELHISADGFDDNFEPECLAKMMKISVHLRALADKIDAAMELHGKQAT